MAADENTFTFDPNFFINSVKKVSKSMDSLATSANNMVKNINGNLDKMKLGKKFNKPVKENVKTMSESIKKTKSLTGGISGLVGKLGLLAIAYKGIQGILKNMPEIGQALGIAKDVFTKNLLFPLRKAVFPLLQKLVDWTRDNRTQFLKWGQVLVNVFKVVGDQIKFIINLGKKFIKGFSSFFEKTFGVSIKSMTELMNILSFKFAVVFTFIQSIITKLTGSIKKFFDGFAEGFNSIGVHSTIMDDITGALTEFFNLLRELEPLLKPLGKLVGQIFGVTLQAAIDTISLGLKGLEQTIGSLVDLIKLVTGDLSVQEFGKSVLDRSDKIFGGLVGNGPDIPEDSAFGKFLTKVFSPGLAEPITREKKVNDAIIKKDGTIIKTHPDDNLIATKGSLNLNPSGNNQGGSSLGGIKIDFSGMQIILPQATVEKAKEMGENLVTTIRDALQTELNAIGEY